MFYSTGVYLFYLWVVAEKIGMSSINFQGSYLFETQFKILSVFE